MSERRKHVEVAVAVSSNYSEPEWSFTNFVAKVSRGPLNLENNLGSCPKGIIRVHAIEFL